MEPGTRQIVNKYGYTTDLPELPDFSTQKPPTTREKIAQIQVTQRLNHHHPKH